jgi:hypothetical protein
MHGPDTALTTQVSELLAFTPETWTPVNRGYTPTKRFVVKGQAGSAFVKIGVTPLTARLLNHEIAVYRSMSGPFMPRLIGWRHDEIHPILIVEDLSSANWPPPWTDEAVGLVIEQIRTLHRTPSDLERRTLLYGGREAGWPTVAANPEPFLSLGMASAGWLETALPVLIEAERKCELEGDATVHFDLRSDNICIQDGVVKIVDWAEAGVSNAAVDLGFFLPSLAYEGGPVPEMIMPNSPEIAALISGYFAARAGLPNIPDAPFVRRVQREQLTTALPWAQRELGLAEPDGSVGMAPA